MTTPLGGAPFLPAAVGALGRAGVFPGPLKDFFFLFPAPG
jgi:hypothetical protein